MHTEVGEDLRTGGVLAGIGRQPELKVGVHGVGPVVLQVVGPQLGQQPDPAALVPPQVQHDPPALGGDGRHRRVELGAAVAAQ